MKRRLQRQVRNIREISNTRKSTDILKAAQKSGMEEVGNAGGKVTKGQALKSLLHHECHRTPSNEYCLLVKAQLLGFFLVVVVGWWRWGVGGLFACFYLVLSWF